ncbi:hypothetical protein VUN84_07015 [Micrococcaceae bacterium Sec5.8]
MTNPADSLFHRDRRFHDELANISRNRNAKRSLRKKRECKSLVQISVYCGGEKAGMEYAISSPRAGQAAHGIPIPPWTRSRRVTLASAAVRRPETLLSAAYCFSIKTKARELNG